MITIAESHIAAWLIYTASSIRRRADRAMDRTREALESRLPGAGDKKRCELEFLIKRLSRGK